MEYELEIRPLAALEIIETFDWYEKQKIGLGLDFLNALDNFYKILLSIRKLFLIWKTTFDKVV